MILTFVNALILLFLTAPIIVVVATAFTTPVIRYFRRRASP